MYLWSKCQVNFDTALTDFNSRQWPLKMISACFLMLFCLTCKPVPENCHICINKGLIYYLLTKFCGFRGFLKPVSSGSLEHGMGAWIITTQGSLQLVDWIARDILTSRCGLALFCFRYTTWKPHLNNSTQIYSSSYWVIKHLLLCSVSLYNVRHGIPLCKWISLLYIESILIRCCSWLTRPA